MYIASVSAARTVIANGLMDRCEQEAVTKGIDDAVGFEVRSQLLAWLHQNVAFVETKAPYLKTKLAVVVTLLIKRDYPDRWPTAFSDLMALLPQGASMVEMYFRILLAINEEIVEFDPQRSQAEANHNMRIKDAMRETTVMAETFDAIYNVLVNCDVSAVMGQLSYSALETLKRYISWVDIALIVNDHILPLLFKMLRESETLRCPAANCLFEIIDKGMTPHKKLVMLQQIQVLELLASLPIQDDDEFAEEIGEVINGIGLELVECMDMFRHEQQRELFVASSTMLQQLMPFVWDLFAHESKDVSEEVFEIVNAVGTLIRVESTAPNAAQDGAFEEVFKPSQYIPQILHGIFRQTRYPEDSDSDAAEFEEYRRSLYKIYVNITRVRPQETLTFLTTVFTQVLSPQFADCDPRDLESYLSLVYRFKEGLTSLKTANSYDEPNSPLFEMVVEIHRRMLSASAPGTPALHPSVLLTYYDLAVRYSRVLQNQAELIPAVLEMMFGSSGLTHPAGNVRSRVCYLCLRLVKAIGASVHPHVSTLLQALQPRLMIPNEAEALARQHDPTFLPYDDQLYLFELAGQVIAALAPSSMTPELDVMEVKYQFTTAVLTPLLQSLNVTLAAAETATTAEAAEDIAERSANLLNATAHVLKAFKGTNCMNNHQATFTQVLNAAAFVLQKLGARHPRVRSKVIFTLHRLTTVLDAEHFLGNVSAPLQQLMMSCEASDALETVQLLDQLIIKHKDAMWAFFNETAVPFVQHLCALMPPRADVSVGAAAAAASATGAAITSNTKDAPQLEREALQKYLFTFLLHVVSHRLDGVLVSPLNSPQLESLLLLVLEGCTDVEDANINRACFSITHELVTKWVLASSAAANGEGVPVPAQPTVLAPEVRAAFVDLVVRRFSPAMFAIARKPHFDVNDVQCATVIKEVGTLQEVLVKALGREYLTFLGDMLVASVGCPPELATTYVEQVATADRKAIASAFKALVGRMK